MLRIDRLVLHLPDEFSGRGKALGRAVGAALAQYRSPQAQALARLVATVRDISPAMSDGAIANAVVRAIAARLDGESGRGKMGPSS